MSTPTWLLAAAEALDEDVPVVVGRRTADRYASKHRDPRLAVSGVQDVGSVPRAVYPPVHRRLWGRRLGHYVGSPAVPVLPRVYVLAARNVVAIHPAVPRLADPRCCVHPGRRVDVNRGTSAGRPPLQRYRRGCLGSRDLAQYWVSGERIQTVVRTLFVDQTEHRIFGVGRGKSCCCAVRIYVIYADRRLQCGRHRGHCLAWLSATHDDDHCGGDNSDFPRLHRKAAYPGVSESDRFL